MRSREDAAPLLSRLLDSGAGAREIAAFLSPRSNLPGPRGNLELAAVFAEAAGARGEGLLPLLVELAAASPETAPVNSPHEFPPFCAVVAAGALYCRARNAGRRTVLRLLEQAATDPRWRMREAAAMGLQRIGESDSAELVRILSRWLPGASDLLKRAILAGLAHPPLLNGRDVEELCMAASSRILAEVAALDKDGRRTEGFGALKKGLGYSLSVFAAAFPDSGFALLRRWAKAKDPDIRSVIRENLKKNRLRKGFPDRVKEVELAAGGTG